MDETWTAIIWDTLEPFNGEEDIPWLIERSEEEKELLRCSPLFAVD